MKILILNGLKTNSINQILLQMLENQEVEIVDLEEKTIKPCLGCFSCWVKTPGKCAIKDDAGDIYAHLMNSDLVIFLSDVVFGGFSSLFKKIQDRMIPVIMPYVKKIKGEIHHTKRYQKYPKVLVIGKIKDESEEEQLIFEELIKRNSLNWHNVYTGGIINNNFGESLQTQIKSLFKKVGLRNEK